MASSQSGGSHGSHARWSYLIIRPSLVIFHRMSSGTADKTDTWSLCASATILMKRQSKGHDRSVRHGSFETGLAEKSRPTGPFDAALADAIPDSSTPEGGTQDGRISVGEGQQNFNRGQYDGHTSGWSFPSTNTMIDMAPNIYPGSTYIRNPGPAVTATCSKDLPACG